MKEKVIKHLESFGITFLAMFTITIVPAITSGQAEASVYIAATLAAARSAFKIAYELALLPLLNYLLEFARNIVK